MNIKKAAALLAAVCAAGILFTACGNKDKTGDVTNTTLAPETGSVTDNTPVTAASDPITGTDGVTADPGSGDGTLIDTNDGSVPLETGDIDGDGFLENTVDPDGGALGEAVRDIVSAAEDVTDGE